VHVWPHAAPWRTSEINEWYTLPPHAFTPPRHAGVGHVQPLRHKDRLISSERREKFESLDLDILLSEFRAVAAHKEGAIEEDEPVQPSPSKNGEDKDGADAELQWLRAAGLNQLADKHERGETIANEDVEISCTREGLVRAEKEAVLRRVYMLNRSVPSNHAHPSTRPHPHLHESERVRACIRA